MHEQNDAKTTVSGPTAPRACPQRGRRRKLSSVRTTRLTLDVPEDLHFAIQGHAARRRMSMREWMAEALQAHATPAAQDRRDAKLSRQLQHFENGIQIAIAAQNLQTTMLELVVQVILGVTPEPLTEEEKKEFEFKVKRRWPRFLNTLVDVLENPERSFMADLEAAYEESEERRGQEAEPGRVPTDASLLFSRGAWQRRDG